MRVTDYLGKFFNWDILARVNRGGDPDKGVFPDTITISSITM